MLDPDFGTPVELLPFRRLGTGLTILVLCLGDAVVVVGNDV